MTRALIVAALSVAAATAAHTQGPAPTPTSTDVSTVAGQRAFIDANCVACHNERVRSGGFTWAEVDLAKPERHAEALEKAILKVRAGMMPPPGPKRPTDASLTAFAVALEAGLDKAAAAAPAPGRPALHRLNRTEYANAVRDLLGLTVDVSQLLPADEMSRGYANISDVLTTSEALIDGYVRAAGRISRLALGDASQSRAVSTYTVPRVVSQLRHIEGTPFGTRGGTSVLHTFPADGEYVFRVSFYYSGLAVLYGETEMQGPQQIEIAVNGERVALLDVDPKLKLTHDLRTPKIKLKAGQQRISAAFIQKADGPVDDVVQPPEQSLVDVSNADVAGLTALPHLRDLAIDGPYDPTGVSTTASRARILTCTPKTTADETPCARDIIGRLASQAFRHPVTGNDLTGLVRFYHLGREEGGFEGGIRTAVQALLTSPEFIFRFERTPAGVAPGATYRVSDVELASRLSFFLWSSTPDAELTSLASAGTLHEPRTLERQVRRMLADARASALSENFASYWLHLQNLKDLRPDSYQYPDYDQNLMQSMTRETQLFFDSIVRNDRPALELLTADYTFIDGRLAKHYGIPGVLGNRFRRVTIADERRRGVLGQSSVLAATSYANRTSPVLRGKWVMDVLLGTPPPKPPANVPPLKENTADVAHASVRSRLEDHRKNPACAACHRMMDPIGFSLENFDVVGLWRDKDSGSPIDAKATLFDGSPLDGPLGLRAAVLRKQGLFVRKLTQDLLMYGLGRVLQPTDMPTVRAIEREAAVSDYRMASIVLGIVKSAPFQMRTAEGPAATSEQPPAGRH